MGIQKVLERASNSELWSCATLLLFAAAVYILWGYLRSVLLSLKLAGPRAVPLLGNCLIMKEKDLMNHLGRAFSLYGRLIRVWVLLFPFFIVSHPDDLQVVLSSKKHTNKVFIYRLLHNFLGNGLITSSGEKWSTHRRLLQPAFHLHLLENFIGTFADAAQVLCRSLEPLLGGSTAKEKGPRAIGEAAGCDINIAKYINTCVVDILNEAVLGVPVKQKNGVDMQQSPFRQGKVVVTERFYQPWLLLDSVYQLTKLASDELDQKRRLDDFTRLMIQRRRDILRGGEAKGGTSARKCLLDHMIEVSDQNPDFTEEDIVNEACTFMLAGQDSVGAAVAFTVFQLAQHGDCQQRCRDELAGIFGDTEGDGLGSDDDRPPTMADLREMRYLEQCIKEALRLYPSVPLIARKLGEEVRLGEYTLPAGSNIFISPYATHRLPHYYPDPERFDPERFAPEQAESRHPYAFIPFSAGPRYCIGNRFAIMEIKTVVSRLLRSYRLLPVPGKTKVAPTFRITLRASGGLWVRLVPLREATSAATRPKAVTAGSQERTAIRPERISTGFTRTLEPTMEITPMLETMTTALETTATLRRTATAMKAATAACV